MEITTAQTKKAEVRVTPAPLWLINFTEKLAPRCQRGWIFDNLRQLRFQSRRHAVMFCLRNFAGTIRSGIWAAFSLWLLLGEALFLCLPVKFLQPAVSSLTIAVIALFVLGLIRLVDAYAYPARGEAGEMVLDAFLAVLVVTAIEGVLWLKLPALALSQKPLLLVGLGALMMASWRMMFHREDPPPPVRKEVFEKHHSTWQMNVLWMLASVPFCLTVIEAIPGSHARDSLLGSVPLLAMMLASAFKKKDFEWFRKPEPRITIRNPQLQQASHMLEALPVRDHTPRFPMDLVAECVFFAFIGWPLAQALWRWMAQLPSAALVNYRLAWVAALAWVMLASLWIQLKRLNEKLASELRLEIKALKAE